MSLASAPMAAALLSALGTGRISAAFGQSTVTVDLAHWLRAAECALTGLGCTLFDQLGASDSGAPGSSGTHWAVVLHVVRLPADGLLLRTVLTAEEALPSVAGVWAGAAWPEREVAEMTGLTVAGHPDLRPLLLAPGAGLHPLRKQTVLVSRAVRPWPGRLEPGESASGPATGRRASAPGTPPPGWGES